MKLIVDLDNVQNKVFNTVSIDNEIIEQSLKEVIEEMNSKESVKKLEDNLALGLIAEMMKKYSENVRFK